MRFRITVRGEKCELRGYIDSDDDGAQVRELAQLMKPFGIVVASPTTDDYEPFTLDKL